jgi:hypothetical protein
MKRIYAIAVLVLLLLICAVAFQYGRGERTAVVIRAAGPLGTNWWWNNSAPQPIWTFTITNGSKKSIRWVAGIDYVGHNPAYSRTGGFVDWPEGNLSPGQVIATNMIVPAGTGSVWRASIAFWYAPSSWETKLWPVAQRVPWLFRAFPCKKYRRFLDGWHQTTNAMSQPNIAARNTNENT